MTLRNRIILPVLTALTICSTLAISEPRWPWRRRVNPNVETFHVTAHKKTPIELWPNEPPCPADVTPERFAAALKILCDTTTERANRYTAWVLQSAGQFDLDPFVLAALIYDQSNCRPVSYKRYQKRGLYSLTHFYPTMHLASVKKDSYRYYIKDDGGWREKTLPLTTPLNRWKAANPRDNVYLAAATLAVFREQFPMLQKEFKWSPYRHYVSNWIFGDWVKNPEPENRILTARRRLIEYFQATPPMPIGNYNGTPLFSPLDGIPRLVIDYFQNRRGNKSGFGHRGIDIDGAIGEPVRAVADGQVVFMGMDKPGGGEHEELSPEAASALTEAEIPQGGGLYVSINHGNDFGTIYMHLDSYCVTRYQKVKAGDIIGTLGQSGSKQSGPHLHLEFRQEEQRVNPAEYLNSVLVNPYKHLPRRIKRRKANETSSQTVTH
ncbi:MAG: M23 family metallopeptidase [Deltaproteobacteria bacterium]|nr:M23 family metallopeptidase [Deltaproteobacteria bacterium]